ncbi:TonB family protein [Sulfuricurvum sp.]|uniref:TonB family protein n=1 Tax=Sulfuricurvum sp. TaxID=2025608 RepID=UPI0025EA7D67|nr:TonB family protein [Sulfuricurvum sp.]
MTSARKSFLLSLMFHSLMGSLAFFVLSQMHTSPPMVKIPLQRMMLVSLSDSESAQKEHEISIPLSETETITPSPIQPILPLKTLTAKPDASYAAPNNTSPAPVVSAPTVTQYTTQNSTSAEAVQTQPKQKIDLAAEKKAFFAALRSTIQNHLRYPSAARRRGMEGEVGVRFNLADDGTINAITVQHGEEIFYTAVKAAVASASGINIPKNLTNALPMEIELILEFKLNS